MSSSPSDVLRLHNLQVSDPGEESRPELPPEQPPPLGGDPRHHTELGLRHEGEDEPDEVPGVDLHLQPAEDVQTLPLAVRVAR